MNQTEYAENPGWVYITENSKFPIPEMSIKYEDIHIIRNFLNSDSLLDSIYNKEKIKIPQQALRLLLEIINRMP